MRGPVRAKGDGRCRGCDLLRGWHLAEDACGPVRPALVGPRYRCSWQLTGARRIAASRSRAGVIIFAVPPPVARGSTASAWRAVRAGGCIRLAGNFSMNVRVGGPRQRLSTQRHDRTKPATRPLGSPPYRLPHLARLAQVSTAPPAAAMPPAVYHHRGRLNWSIRRQLVQAAPVDTRPARCLRRHHRAARRP